MIVKTIFITIIFFKLSLLWADAKKRVPTTIVKKNLDINLLSQTKISEYPNVLFVSVANASDFYDVFLKVFMGKYSFLENGDKAKFTTQFKARCIAKVLNLELKEVELILKDLPTKHKAFYDSLNQQSREKLTELAKTYNKAKK